MLKENVLILDGKKVLLFGAEMHFWRIDPEYWEECLSQLKLIGINIVSTYISWRRHSISPFENDLVGRTDPKLNLPSFLKICSKLNIWVNLKPGPWICAEEEKGGYPDWLFDDEEILVKNSEGKLVSGYNPPYSSYIPSYLHPKYLEYVRKWLADVDSNIREFCYPQGPIILIQLDNEPSMTFHDGAFESDYNSVIVKKGGLYQKWLSRKYDSLESLNLSYNTNLNHFFGVTAPRFLSVNSIQDLKRYMDWAEFKEWLLAEYIKNIRRIHIHNKITDVLFTVNLNEHYPMSVPNNWYKLEEASSGICGYDYYAIPPPKYKDYINFIKAINYSLSVLKIPWAPEMMCGIWEFGKSKRTSRDEALVTTQMNIMYWLCLAFGLKGINFYMFVNRENWKYAPVDEKGSATKTYSIVRKVINFVNSLEDFSSLKKEQEISVMFYRPYAWESYIASGKRIKVENLQLGKGYDLFESVYKSLVRLNYDPAIVDPFVNKLSDISKYKVVIVPSNIYMDKETQEFIRRYAENGGIAVFYPALPSLDMNFKLCNFFRNHQESNRVDVSQGFEIEEILIGNGKIMALKCDNKSNSDSNKVSADFLNFILKHVKIKPKVEADKKGILLVIQRNDFEKILFIINTNTRFKIVELKFSNIKNGSLRDFFSKEIVNIKEKKAVINIKGSDVRIFRILE